MTKISMLGCAMVGVAALIVGAGCRTPTATDVEMAKVTSQIPLAYYAQPRTAEIVHAVGSNVTFTISGASELTLSTPVPPASIYPRDQGTIEAIVNGLKDIVPWGVAGYVGGKLAARPTTVKPEVVQPQVVTVPATP